METKTSDSYQKAVLAKYKKERGGEMSSYLTKPTRRQIRKACLWLLNKRNTKNDQHTLRLFFQFEEDDNRISKIQKFDGDKFLPIINFLKGKTRNTSIESLELIGWLIDFRPRPLQEYLKSGNLVLEEDESSPETLIVPGEFDTTDVNELEKRSEEERKKKENEKIKRKKEATTLKQKEKKGRSRLIITISIAFGMICFFVGIQNWPLIFPNNNPGTNGCLTWADSLYVEVACDIGPYSEFGTEVKPIEQIPSRNMRKVKVHAAYDFFTEDNKPRIWYYKSKDGEIEYFTYPGRHPVNGETLKKITPYIIEKYVDKHRYNAGSFLAPNNTNKN